MKSLGCLLASIAVLFCTVTVHAGSVFTSGDINGSYAMTSVQAATNSSPLVINQGTVVFNGEGNHVSGSWRNTAKYPVGDQACRYGIAGSFYVDTTPTSPNYQMLIAHVIYTLLPGNSAGCGVLAPGTSSTWFGTITSPDLIHYTESGGGVILATLERQHK